MLVVEIRKLANAKRSADLSRSLAAIRLGSDAAMESDFMKATIETRREGPSSMAAGAFAVLMRLSLSLSFFIAVGDRFGFFGPPGTAGVAWGDFAHFVAYTAKVNSFAPRQVAPILAIAATICETTFAIGLILGVYTRLFAAASGILLFLFGVAMAISFGITRPFDYSVFSAMSGALMLAMIPTSPVSIDRYFRCHAGEATKKSTVT